LPSALCPFARRARARPPLALALAPALALPSDLGPIDYEVELALEVGRRISRATPEQAAAAIARVGIALDLTARDLQAKLKEERMPWLLAKGFDGACVLGPRVSTPPLDKLAQMEVRLEVDGEDRQRFRVADYAVQPAALLARASRSITIEPGDILSCGTGPNVGALRKGNKLVAEIVGLSGTGFAGTVQEGP
jgi:2-keto-4-pentenoate hydratase/2-oxohepta-3-ene-1,7-dioic acid hydratase in catechol pathway